MLPERRKTKQKTTIKNYLYEKEQNRESHSRVIKATERRKEQKW